MISDGKEVFMPENSREYDVVIVGAGVTGTAVAFMLSKYTNIPRIALIEKNAGVAEVNSHPRNNSQTLHFGDIETNYSFAHALELKRAGEMIARYVERKNKKGLFRKINKMVLGVGCREVEILQKRFTEFRNIYPTLSFLNREEITALEPKVAEGRHLKKPIAALANTGYMVNYQLLAECFLEDVLASKKHVDVLFSTTVNSIAKSGRLFMVETSRGTLRTQAVHVASGAYSLGFAHSLGYGKNFAVIPIAGSFYFSSAVLNGKVYTIQEEGRPFAAIHGDPDIVVPDTTRFGPTAKIVFLMERRHIKTLFDFLRTPMTSARGLCVLAKVIWNAPSFAVKNALYDIPFIGKLLYLREVQKIIPSMKYRDLCFGKGIGGLRPQMVDMETGALLMGESKIIGENIICDTTPSPGATSSLRNAEKNTRMIVKFCKNGGASFDEELFARDFG